MSALDPDYPAFFRAGDYRRLGPPGSLVERARRLYVLGPLIDVDWDWTPTRFEYDPRSRAVFYDIDLRQGESVTLAVCHAGVVLFGATSEADTRLWESEKEADEDLQEMDKPARVLLSVLFRSWRDPRGRTFCVWRASGSRRWSAAPAMLATPEARREPLGLVDLLTFSPRYVGQFVTHMTESASAGRFAQRFLGEHSPSLRPLRRAAWVPSEALPMIQERAYVSGLYTPGEGRR